MLIAPKNSVPAIKDSLNTPAYEIKLETVFGLTVSSNAALDCDPNSDLVAYPAGCTVVLYNTRKNRQSHLLNSSRKTITCVAFSGCGRYLASGECGHAPCVRIWDLHDGTQLAEFPSHKYGVNCVTFSVNSKYLVSVGSQHDMIVNVWDWKAGLKLASNKVSSKVKAVSFHDAGSYFVTVGNRHVKFWYLESKGAKYKEPVPLMGRSAILGEQRNNDFCDVACGRGAAADSTFAITRGGLLCEFNGRRLLDKWVELRTPSANCMSLGNDYIFVGCADGIVRCFSPTTLQFVTTLPRTHYLGVDVSQGLNISHMFAHPPNARYPDAIALTYDEKNQRLTCVYNDHSFYVWDVRDIKRVGKSHSSLYHSACIWGVEVAGEAEEGETGGSPALPPGSFLTCSSDDTVRVWGLPAQNRNIYSQELQRVLYMDPELTYLKDVDLSSAGEKDKPVSYDGKNGVRCIRVSGDGQHLASGDRAGNVRVHDLKTMKELCRLEAHNAEVLCLEYCGGTSDKSRSLLASASRDRLIHVFDVDEDYKFMQTLDDHSSSITAVRFLSGEAGLQMVSCGADKTILFRSLVDAPSGGGGQFVRGHNCSARSTLYDMEVDAGGRHVLAACQDRAVRVYNTRSGRHTKTFRASPGDEGSLIKVVLDRSGIYVATSCTNKSLSVYDYYSGECMATMYGHSELVTGLRFTADCQHIISASGDGCIFVWRVPHDMVVTMKARLAQQAIRQGRRPPSSNGIGLDSESDRAASPMLGIAEDPLVLATRANPAKPGIPQLDLGRLPPWAQKTISGETGASRGAPPPSAAPLRAVVRGKWAKRAENSDYYMEPERPLESDGSKDSSLDSGTDTRIYRDSKQELMDTNNKKAVIMRPGSLNLRSAARRPLSLNLSMLSDQWWARPPLAYRCIPERDYNENLPMKPSLADRVRHLTDDSSLGSFKYEDHESTEHDGDVEDISDGERTSSSDHNTQVSDRIIYYPSNNEDNTPSEYTVNAMDVEELRQSQRRMKKPLQLPLQLPQPPTVTLSPLSQDSEEDEDEVSTPSGDNGDRNVLSGSCESLEKIAHRTSLLKSAFENLDMEANLVRGGALNSSISSQHQQAAPRAPAVPPRNAALINAAKQSLADSATSSRRQELTRRIEETKKQLESVGYRSKLKASQSTMDLSREEPRAAGRSRPLSQHIPGQRGHAEKRASNPPLTSTNPTYITNRIFEGKLRNKDLEIDNGETFFDSLMHDANQNRHTVNNQSAYDTRYKNPYDIPANVNLKYTYALKLEDLNCTASEFVKKRQGQFENKQDINKYKHSIGLNRNIDERGNDNGNGKDAGRPKAYAFTVDFGKESAKKVDSQDRGGKVFDRLFPNVSQKHDQGRNVTQRAGNPPSRNFTLNLNSNTQSSVKEKTNTVQAINKSHKSRSILKNYKSCPVSPVSEECKWGDTHLLAKASDCGKNSIRDNVKAVYERNSVARDIRKRNSLSYFMDFDTNSHLMKDNGKSLVDTIKSDTEKMIAEITKKYGDLDDYEPNSGTSDYKVDSIMFDKFGKKEEKTETLEKKQTKDVEYVLNEKDDGNFSSDSLEDCSLSQDISNRNKVYSKKVCKKHQKSALSSIARRCVSDYEIYAGIDEKNANYEETYARVEVNHPFGVSGDRQQKSFTLPKNMPSNLEEYADAYYDSGSHDQINVINNNVQRCCSALTKRCITRSNESVLSDENSNCSSMSNEIFMKYGDQNAFLQRKLYEKQCVDDSQNCSYENICYETEAAYLEKHRHSSASFFLNQRKLMKTSASQESVLSDDLLQSDSDNQLMSKTNCNSLESILSDDSEYTKSAPLEMLFEHRKHIRKPEIVAGNPGVCIPKSSQSCYEFENTSKSYGSSPNNTSNFGSYKYYDSLCFNDSLNYIQKNVITARQGKVNITEGFNIGNDENNGNHKTVTRSLSLQDSSTNNCAKRKNIAYYFDGNEIKEYEQTSTPKRSDEIPSMKSKNEEYNSNQSKSLMKNCENKYKYMSSVEGLESSCISKSKSCSFEVLMEPVALIKPKPKISEKSVSHVQKNLEKFENQIRKHAQSKMERTQNHRQPNSVHKTTVKTLGATKSLERNTQGNKNANGKPVVDFVPHKPPKPVKRTSSVKLTNRNRVKVNMDKYPGLDSGLGATVRAKIDGLQLKNSNAFMGKGVIDRKRDNMGDSDNGEKSFNMFVAEKEAVDNKSEIQMDSLEFLANQKKSERMSEFSLDSLDNILDDRSHDNFAKDSLNYESFGESSKFDANSTNLTANNFVKNSVLNKNMPFLKVSPKDADLPSSSGVKMLNLSTDSSVDGTGGGKRRPAEDINIYKDIERKICIINKLVELEERKILQEKYLKECRMRPLKANFSDGKGTVKILSRNFEKLASKHQSKGTLEANDFFSLTYDDFESDSEEKTIKTDIKRNRSLPDVLDAESVALLSCFEEKFIPEDSLVKCEEIANQYNDNGKQEDLEEKEVLNNSTEGKSDCLKCPEKNKDLKQRVYNLTVIPKTDIHLDSENYESSTTSSSCTNSPKRLFFGSSGTKPKTSRISSLFRNKFDRGRLPAYLNMKLPSKANSEATPVVPVIFKARPVAAINSDGKPESRTFSSGGLARKLSLQQPILPSKPGFGQGSRTRLSPNDFNAIVDEDTNANSGLRRAISLSDLAFKPSPSPRMSLIGGAGKTSTGGGGKSTSSRPAGRHGKPFSSGMTRSSSVGVLNQSDSESEAGATGGARAARAGGLMRPTISSQNKAVQAAAARRRGVQAAYSSVNLSSVGQEDSSSEEAGAAPPKPAVPPRPPRSLVDSQRRNMGRSGSERDLSSKAREVTQRLTAGIRTTSGFGPPTDPSTGQVTPLACQQLAQQLTKLTAKIVHMYSSLGGHDMPSEGIGDNADMLQGLESAMLDAQSMLSKATGGIRLNGAAAFHSLSSGEGDGNISPGDVHSMTRTLDELVSKGLPTKNGELNQGQAMTMMDQYSDILYDMVNKFGSNGNTNKNYDNGKTYDNTTQGS